MNTWEDLIPILLLILVGIALGSGIAIVSLARRARRQEAQTRRTLKSQPSFSPVAARSIFIQRPASWLAIRSRQLDAVQSALALSNPTPCTWSEGVSGDKRLFIAPPVNGWILVTGAGLPDPADDVDACFRCLLALSRKLGHVQFFSANRVLNHHAWVRLEGGTVIRAYAWADKTVWDQGVKTRAELELGVKCYRYLEIPDRSLFGPPDAIVSNTDKVPALAAHWSLDPASIDDRILDQAVGIAGEPSQFY